MKLETRVKIIGEDRSSARPKNGGNKLVINDGMEMKHRHTCFMYNLPPKLEGRASHCQLLPRGDVKVSLESGPETYSRVATRTVLPTTSRTTWDV